MLERRLAVERMQAAFRLLAVGSEESQPLERHGAGEATVFVLAGGGLRRRLTGLLWPR